MSDKASDELDKTPDSSENPIAIALNDIGGLSDEELLKLLSDIFPEVGGKRDDIFPDDPGKRGSYKCSACGKTKTEKKIEHGKSVSIPHQCPALMRRVQELQELLRSRDMDISTLRLTELLNLAEARMRADPKASIDNTPRRGAGYKCGRCGHKKKGHKCQVELREAPMHLYGAPNETSISTSIDAPLPFEQGEQEEPTYAQPDKRCRHA